MNLPEYSSEVHRAGCRDSDTQTALLDRIAGTTAAAAAFGQKLQRRRDLRSQLAAINELGDENRREELQALVDNVSPRSTSLLVDLVV